MKRPRSKKRLLVGFGVVVGLVFLLLVILKPKQGAGDWLQVSPPHFASLTNADGTHGIVYFTASNVGPRTVRFGIPWYECRDKTDLTPLGTTAKPGGFVYGLREMIRLAPGATVQFTNDLAPSTAPAAERLFCCELDWFENVAIGSPQWIFKRIDSLMTRALSTFQLTWKPLYAPRSGVVFTSNVKMAQYFFLVYGSGRRKPEDPSFEFAAQSAFKIFCIWGPPKWTNWHNAEATMHLGDWPPRSQ